MAISRSRMKQRSFPLDSEITRDEIQRITGATNSKVYYISQSSEYGFPPRLRIVNRCAVYDRAKVLQWINDNNLSDMAIKGSSNNKRKIIKQSFNQMAVCFLTKKRENEITRVPEDKTALVNRYKKPERKLIELNFTHSEVELSELDAFTVAHDVNHRYG